jgi:hypothetical protein
VPHALVFVWRGCGQRAEVERVLRQNDPEVVELDNFEAPLLSMHMSDLTSFSDGPLLPRHVFNPDSFAANDLVFATE